MHELYLFDVVVEDGKMPARSGGILWSEVLQY